MAASEKKDKAASHRTLRRISRRLIEVAPESPLPVERKLVDPWNMAKDGKMRFDPREDPKKMRK